ncbi:MAG TPA: ABC transporter permease [Bryobacteraceae bacterium]|nr:ABC transporter permease [Bryobacteraceae bacterium]
MNSFFRKLSWLTRRRSKEQELRDELQFHLEEETEEHQAKGLENEEALRAARRGLGNITLLEENTRAMWSWTFCEQFAQDVRYALRTMAHNRGFTLLAALSLALGIGANTAIFSFMDAILLRSLPVSDPQSLVRMVWHTQRNESHGTNYHDSSYYDAKTGQDSGVFPYPALEVFRRNDSVFSTVFGFQGTGKLNLTIQGQAEVADGEYVSGDYFRGLGIVPAAGRLLGPDDDRAGAPPVVVINFALSQRRFAGPGNAVGQPILINNIPFTVAGVAPPEFFGTDLDLVPDFYLPMHSNLLLDAANLYSAPAGRYMDTTVDWVDIMARLRPGVNLAQAQATLAPQFAQYESANPTKRGRDDLPKLVMKEGGAGIDALRRRYSKPLYLLMTMVGLILAIACANIANLQLARASARRREIAVRLSMGAGRGRVIRQLLTESVLLALLGGAAGVGFGVWGSRLLTILLASGRENFTLGANLNWHVLAVAAVLSLLTGVLFGLAPAIQSTRVGLIPALKESRTGETRSRSFLGVSLGHALVVSQIAMSLLMLVAAGLFVGTLGNLESIELGFNRDRVLTFRLNAWQAGHRDAEIGSFYNELRRRFSEIPGVRNASLSSLPLIGGGNWFTSVSAAGAKPRTSKIVSVGQDFFTTMQVPVLLGRAIEERDVAGAPVVAVVDQVFAKANFGAANPLGQHLRFPHDACPKCDVEIVGLSSDVRVGRLKEKPPPVVYLSFSQGVAEPPREMVFELRTAGNPLGYVNAVREIVRQADARLPVSEVTTQKALIDGTISQEITFARLCSAFAMLALAIACVGLYGTVSYNVARRTGEIGIRMALGARRGTLVWMVLRGVLTLAAVGLAISVPIALGASKLVGAFLFDMKPNDPVTLALAVVTLLCAAVLAGYAPARKASRIDPMIALRQE